jgi:secondary thiamine-phosphate synthase enzyme
MRGNLNGSLKNARLVFSDLGPTMPSYDFTVQGSKREGRPIRFFGRAVNSIMELMGSRKSEMPWYAQTALHYSIIFRNLFSATADYFGFHAQTKGEWTEVTTFDPPSTKNHYILYGTAFTIPLNTHGVYPALLKTNDFQEWLKKLAPMNPGQYKHNLTGEDNAYAHLWRTIMGREVVVAVTNGKLDFGPWEQIYYAEFDGQRKKRVMVKVIGE